MDEETLLMLAMAVDSGTWTTKYGHAVVANDDVMFTVDGHHLCPSDQDAIAAYVAAANPTRILAMLRELVTLRSQVRAP